MPLCSPCLMSTGYGDSFPGHTLVSVSEQLVPPSVGLGWICALSLGSCRRGSVPGIFQWKLQHLHIKTKMLLFSCVGLFVTPWTAAHQASLSLSTSQSLFKLMSIELMTPSNHLILCFPLLLLPSLFPSIRVFSNESALQIRWPKYWSFSFSISPSNEYSGLISFRKQK